MAIEKILVIDDEELITSFIAETLKRSRYEVATASNGKEGLALFKEKSFDLVFTDMKMPDFTGIEVLAKIKEHSPATLVVVITAYGSIENAVEAMRLGAFNYLIKPFSPEIIETVVEKANEHQKLLNENQYLREEIYKKGNLQELKPIAESPDMKQILKDVSRIAKSNASVFITGESGTGKEVIAQAIHSQSLRNNRPFIKVNCAAIPETLLESEFFGHEKGSFTGAHVKRVGRFELAHGGTLLLDEVTEIPLVVQAKLLRAIQEHTFERVGGTKPINVDVRIISTSNRNIKDAIESKILREDLYYRLNVVPIHLSPLRERPEDILPLARHFLQKNSQENHKEVHALTNEAENKLLVYHWPGNVRELANIIERAVVMASAKEIGPEYLYLDLASKTALNTQKSEDSSSRSANLSNTAESQEMSSQEMSSKEKLSLSVGMSLQELEKKLIIETLNANNNNKKKTAEVLGISARTLRNKLQEYQLKDPTKS